MGDCSDNVLSDALNSESDRAMRHVDVVSVQMRSTLRLSRLAVEKKLS